LTNSEPLPADRERLTFELPAGFRAQCVAAEPDVIDPVALAFDEKGRLFVAEMFGYPNGGRGTGIITSGRIKLLEDRDGDGVYETSTVFAQGLRFPTGVFPWRGGVLVANAPDLVFIPKAGAKPRVLYTGFDVANIQQLLNSFTLGIDGLIYANAGGAGGTITCPEKPDFAPVSLRGRGIRFDPDVPGSLEPTSGGGQFGLTHDAYGRWFTATNSQHLRHIVLADEDIRRNPHLAVGATTLDIPEHGAACKVFRRSPFEAWRLERTTRRAGSADAKRFPPTELIAGGYVTSACSPLVYDAPLFPPEYRGSVFICDPANNVLIRDTLHPHGSTFIARRGHKDSEFLASTDNWFRPVALTHGPDGALYVADFYREVIETPLSLPPDILARVNVQSRARGRIWRITPTKEGARPKMVLPTADASHLNDPNVWVRMTAMRLLKQAGIAEFRDALEKVARTGTPAGRVLAMGLLRDAAGNTTHDEPGVREVALRYISEAGPAIACGDDAAPRVRYQAALSLSRFEGEAVLDTLVKLANQKDADVWMQTALLIAARGRAGSLLTRLPATAPLRPRLATLVGARGDPEEIVTVLDKLDDGAAEVLDGLGAGLRQSGLSLDRLLLQPSAAPARKLFDRAAATARDPRATPVARAEAVRLLGYGQWEPLAKVAPELLNPRVAPEVQRQTVRALSAHDRPEVAGLLLAAWPSAGPDLRREMSEALFARPQRVTALLDALEKKRLAPTQLEPARLAQLRKTPRGAKVLAGAIVPARAKVVQDYADALKLEGDIARGKQVFAKNCAACHRLEGVGHQVGADLLAALRNKDAHTLLIDILDPSREVDPRFLAYQVRTTRGTTFSGLIATDTATAVTLKRGDGAEDIIPRRFIETVESTGQSLMPEGLEMQINRQEMADLLRYLLSVR
jgi:putative membrane-bound dehydrogenase-like protein